MSRRLSLLVFILGMLLGGCRSSDGNLEGVQAFDYREAPPESYEEPGSEGGGLIFGLFETTPLADAEGTCLILLGTLTPTKTQEGAASERFTLPVFLTLDRTSSSLTGAEPEDDVCDVSEARQAGYRSLLDAEVTVGDPYPFYAEFSYDGYVADPLELIVGGFHRPTTVVLEPTIINSVPQP